jgi:hypothetical protein
VSKYAWHLPLYRQAQMLAAQGLDIKRSTLAFWVGYAAAELWPVFERLRELILTSGKIAVDETKAPVLDPGRGRVKEGYFWAVARDDRPWGGADPPAIAFAYAMGVGRHRMPMDDVNAGRERFGDRDDSRADPTSYFVHNLTGRLRLPVQVIAPTADSDRKPR